MRDLLPPPDPITAAALASEFAKCLCVFFVLPPTLTVAAYALVLWVR